MERAMKKLEVDETSLGFVNREVSECGCPRAAIEGIVKDCIRYRLLKAEALIDEYGDLLDDEAGKEAQDA